MMCSPRCRLPDDFTEFVFLMEPGYEARSGDEWDVTTGWRRWLSGFKRPGITSWIKRNMRRRGRRYGKKLVRMDVE